MHNSVHVEELPDAINMILFFTFLYLGFQPVKIISLILSRVHRKVGDPREKPPDHMQAELGLSHV